MFVAELDRPWVGSPFLLQGFLIESEDDLSELRGCCKFVYVDRTRSVGAHKREEVVERAKPEAVRAAPRGPEMSARREPGKSLSFHEVVRMLKEGGAPPPPATGESGSPPQPQGVTMRAGSTLPSASLVLEADPARLGGSAGGGMSGLLQSVGGLFRRNDDDAQARARNLKVVPDAPEQPRRFGGFTVTVYEDATTVEEELVASAPIFVQAQQVVDQLMQDIEQNRAPDVAKVRDTVGCMVQSVMRNSDALVWLTKLRSTDQYSYDHALDVSVHVMVFGRFVGLPEDQLNLLGMAALMQDVGKIRIPDALLQKPGKLSELEMKLVKTHVFRSMELVRKDPELPAAVAEIVERHHERFDGSGYPKGLKGEQIGVLPEMSGLVDCYCAMVRSKPYAEALRHQVALEEINRMRGTLFSEPIVDQFIQCFGLYPIGTLVELNTGEVAVVIAQNRVRRLKPRVMVLLGPDKAANKYPPTLDLLYDPLTAAGDAYRIVRALEPNAYGINPQEFYLA